MITDIAAAVIAVSTFTATAMADEARQPAPTGVALAVPVAAPETPQRGAGRVRVPAANLQTSAKPESAGRSAGVPAAAGMIDIRAAAVQGAIGRLW